jgi:hypothetical protein
MVKLWMDWAFCEFSRNDAAEQGEKSCATSESENACILLQHLFSIPQYMWVAKFCFTVSKQGYRDGWA